MNINHLRVLVAIADGGSISAAADRIGLTQSGASQAVAALEEQLGVRLALRERRGATLTAVGEEIVAQARQVLSAMDAIRRVADAAQGLEHGRIRVGAFPTVFATLLPPLLRRFRTRHPGVEVTALEGTDAEVEGWIVDGTVDVGVVLKEPRETAVFLGRDTWVAVVPPAHALARRAGRAVALADLAREPFVLATGGCRIHGRDVMQSAGVNLTNVRVEVRDYASAFALVREGVGIALVPTFTLPDDRRGLRVLRLNVPVYREFWLQPTVQSAHRPAVRALLQLAADQAAARDERPAERGGAHARHGVAAP